VSGERASWLKPNRRFCRRLEGSVDVAAGEISDERLTRPFNARIEVVALGGIALGRVPLSRARFAREPQAATGRAAPRLRCGSGTQLSLFSVLREAGIHDTAGLKEFGAVTALAIPFATLLGQLRGQLFAIERLGELIARVSGDPVTSRMETLLREALGDLLLTLAVYDRTSAG
jgi:hypothetical protein